MYKKENNYAFIDSQNLNLNIKRLGWRLDFARFRIYLKDKHSVTKAYLFIGYIPGNNYLYHYLQQSGYVCIFKPALIQADGTVKGNCDAELVLHAMIEYKNYHQAVIVSGDGDFYCLVRYLIKQKKLKKLLIPNQNRYSALLKKFDSGYIAFVSDQQVKLAKNEKNPARTEP